MDDRIMQIIVCFCVLVGIFANLIVSTVSLLNYREDEGFQLTEKQLT